MQHAQPRDAFLPPITYHDPPAQPLPRTLSSPPVVLFNLNRSTRPLNHVCITGTVGSQFHDRRQWKAIRVPAAHGDAHAGRRRVPLQRSVRQDLVSSACHLRHGPRYNREGVSSVPGIASVPGWLYRASNEPKPSISSFVCLLSPCLFVCLLFRLSSLYRNAYQVQTTCEKSKPVHYCRRGWGASWQQYSA